MAEEYIGICAACTKGVTRDTMKYVNGRVFHPECYQKHGKDFLAVDQELAAKTAKLKIDLIQLKNLKSRRSSSKKSPTTKNKTKRKSTKKKAKRKTAKTKRSKPKARTKRKTAKTKRSKPKARTKRKTAKKRRR